jgi:WD40 repeat protein
LLAWVLFGSIPQASAEPEQAPNVKISIPIPHSGDILAVAFSHRGHVIATAGQDDSSVKLWDALTGRFIRSEGKPIIRSDEDKPTGISAIAFSPNDSLIVAGGEDGSLTVWETETGSLIRSFPAHDNQIDGLEY